jgi:hypothetical protein
MSFDNGEKIKLSTFISSFKDVPKVITAEDLKIKPPIQ